MKGQTHWSPMNLLICGRNEHFEYRVRLVRCNLAYCLPTKSPFVVSSLSAQSVDIYFVYVLY